MKGGRAGEREDRFLDRSLIGIGWDDMGDLSAHQDRDALKGAYRVVYQWASPGNVNAQAGQLWAFANVMKPGDHVVVPLKTRGRRIAVGRITGPYKWDGQSEPDMRHVRSVEWIIRDLARTQFDKDLLYSFGASQTISTASRNSAEQRVLAMVKAGGAPAAAIGPPEPDVDEPVDRDLEQDGRDEIIDFIRSRFKGHGLGRIVDALLRAQGLETRVSPPGPDGGVDIVAGGGVMGFDEPRIVVQVKSQQGPADVTVLRELKGTMSDFGADRGLLVCWGGFKETLVREARNGYFKIRLWDQDALLSALFAHYENLDEELRAELPLKRVWTVAREALVEEGS